MNIESNWTLNQKSFLVENSIKPTDKVSHFGLYECNKFGYCSSVLRHIRSEHAVWITEMLVPLPHHCYLHNVHR